MNQIQVNLLHDLKKIASIINDLDCAVGALIADLDNIITGEPDEIRNKGRSGDSERDTENSR